MECVYGVCVCVWLAGGGGYMYTMRSEFRSIWLFFYTHTDCILRLFVQTFSIYFSISI